MENTLENKAKFFAHYYSVPCIENDNWIWRSKDKFKDLPYGSDITDCYAVLKPLSSITDEEIESIRPLVGYSNTEDGLKLVRRWLTPMYKEDYNWFALEDKKNVLNTISIIDYLRSKGYAVPYMGLSVEKQIEYGWIKLLD